MRLILLSAILASLANAAAASKPQPPICIVGAGVSGLTTAKALEDKGHKTVIFEKRDTVGGKCQSHYEDGQYFPLGAVLFTGSPSYAETFKVVSSSGVGFDKFDPAFAYDYNPKTGAAALTQPPSPAVVQALQEELARYAGVWQKDFAPIGVPGYKANFFKVLKRISKTIKGPIHLGAKIERINRSRQPSIRYHGTNGRHTKTQLCSDIIIAFPPTSQALKSSGLVLSAAEKTLFAQVGVNGYFSSAVRMNKLGDNLTVSQELPNPLDPFKPEGQPVYLTPLHPESNIVNVYSADDPAHPSVTRVKKHLIHDLSKINKDLGNAYAVSTKLGTADIRAFSGQIDYFPHLGPEALADGWYEKFNHLQGKDNTYFISGLNSFELVEYTIRAARDLVATHF
ncbi:hypothetical protein IL306_001010 [Fusarium sp. DS 682]|nr:hypothetical protein IL306_001010 [Fusarium sp. DS 682]